MNYSILFQLLCLNPMRIPELGSWITCNTVDNYSDNYSMYVLSQDPYTIHYRRIDKRSHANGTHKLVKPTHWKAMMSDSEKTVQVNGITVFDLDTYQYDSGDYRVQGYVYLKDITLEQFNYLSGNSCNYIITYDDGGYRMNIFSKTVKPEVIG